MIFDALNGSLVDDEFVDATAFGPEPVVVHLTVNNLHRITPDPELPQALSDLGDYLEKLDGFGHRVRVVRSREDLDRVLSDHCLGVVLGYQNSSFVGSNLAVLRVLRDVGVRIMQVTHSGPNRYGDGCGVGDAGGLTELGAEFVREANRLGIVLDGSHCSDATVLDMAARSTAPVAITHASCGAVTAHRRNRSDRAIRAVADSGGVIGVCFLPALVSTEDAPTVADVADHVVHLLDVAGADAIGFGSDFIVNQDHGERYAALRAQNVSVIDNVNFPLDGLDDMGRLRDELRGRGVGAHTIDKFMGLNFANYLEGFLP